MSLRAVTAVCRSVWVPRVLTVVGLILGVPMVLRMPPWVDITLYDNAARCILHGGAHYRDVFDTNPPGFVWALTAIRAILGPSYEALWVVDLVIVLGVVLLIDRLVRWGGATPVMRWWALAGATFFYLFVTEGIHAQRDVWQSLPALAAIILRVRRTRRNTADAPKSFRCGLLEGVLWGLAVWVKPHILVMAAGSWFLTIRRVAGDRFWARAALDFAGNILGGLAVGLAGFGLLVASGSWPAYWEVITIWNGDYIGLIRRELEERYTQQLFWFPPWSIFFLPTVPLAVLSVLDGRVWSARVNPNPGPGWLGRWLPRWLYDPGADDNVRYARAVLGGCYLVWAAQSLYLQRGFQYAHVTETLMMLGLWATHRWALSAVILGWFALTSGLWLAADASPAFRERLLQVASTDQEREHYFLRHPLADPNRMRWWLTCWEPDLPPVERGRLRDGLKYVHNHEASIGWEELEEVAAFLNAQDSPIRDGELICWHDSPHALYLRLGVKPSIRFMHVYTVMVMGPEAQKRLFGELDEALRLDAQPRVRFIVSDLQIVTLAYKPKTEAWAAAAEMLREPGTPDDLLPPRLGDPWRSEFPFYHKAVFRSGGGRGRYIIHDAHEFAPFLREPPPPPEPKLGPGMKSVLRFLRDD